MGISLWKASSVSLALVLLFTFSFWCVQAPPTPQPTFEIKTTLNFTESIIQRIDWATIEELSDDGTRAILIVNHGQSKHSTERRAESWNLKTGENTTPTLWRNPQWQRFLDTRLNRSVWPDRLIISTNDEAFAAMQTSRLQGTLDASNPTFSPDGLLVAYHRLSRTIVENLKTNTIVADLPTSDRVIIDPGNRMAISEIASGDSNERSLLLWDLKTSRVVTALAIKGENYLRPEFTPDGHYLFVQQGSGLTWWDMTNANQIGHIADAGYFALVDSGPVLITYRNSFRIWSASNAKKLGEWDPGESDFDGRYFMKLVPSQSDRYLATQCDLPAGLGPSSNRLVALWDLKETRLISRLPGRSARFSQNGQWIGTIDDEGIVRVWAVSILTASSENRAIKDAVLVAATSLVLCYSFLFLFFFKYRKTKKKILNRENHRNIKGDAAHFQIEQLSL
jgi:WD40 repeat protein